MISNIDVKEKINRENFDRNVKTLAAVHTHTHTVYCLLVNKKCIFNNGYNNKDRTVLNVENTGLSLLAFMQNLRKLSKGTVFFDNILLELMDLYIKVKNKKLNIVNKNYRAGPIRSSK